MKKIDKDALGPHHVDSLKRHDPYKQPTPAPGFPNSRTPMVGNVKNPDLRNPKKK